LHKTNVNAQTWVDAGLKSSYENSKVNSEVNCWIESLKYNSFVTQLLICFNLANMRKIVIEFPDSFNISDVEAVTAMAAQLYEMGKLSIGQAAELAGYEKREFLEILGTFGVSVFNYPVDDIDNDIQNADIHNI
jgi:predicted HTH domain antitoxin